MLSIRAMLCLACLAAGFTATFARGQAVPSPAGSYDTQVRLAALEQEVMMLRSQATANAMCASSSSQGCRASRDTACGQVHAGFEFLFLKPHLKESFDATSTNLLTGVMTLVPYSFDYDLAPRVWLGFETPTGLGARVRYWQYDHRDNPLTLVSDPTTIVSAQSMTVIFPDDLTSTAPGQTLRTSARLEAQTLDVEATQSLSIGRVDAVVSGGVRYAKFEQNFGAMLADDESILGQLAWLRRFEGFGVTVGAEFRRPLGNSGLSAFASGQGALLFGSKDLQRVDADALPPVVRLDSADEVVGMGEMEIGLEWSRRLALGDVFVRGTYGGQLWTEAGAPTLTFLGFEGFGLSLGLAR